MTHKNPELRASSVVKAADSEPVASAQPVKSATGSAKKPPKLALEGHKWVVENYDNNRELIVETTELKQVVYIYNCNNSVIQIKGKVNAVIIGMCHHKFKRF
jgi:adenylyl cyclase-associated protein